VDTDEEETAQPRLVGNRQSGHELVCQHACERMREVFSAVAGMT
jgi:hypothetical protein